MNKLTISLLQLKRKSAAKTGHEKYWRVATACALRRYKLTGLITLDDVTLINTIRDI